MAVINEIQSRPEPGDVVESVTSFEHGIYYTTTITFASRKNITYTAQDLDKTKQPV